MNIFLSVWWNALNSIYWAKSCFNTCYKQSNLNIYLIFRVSNRHTYEHWALHIRLKLHDDWLEENDDMLWNTVLPFKMLMIWIWTYTWCQRLKLTSNRFYLDLNDSCYSDDSLKQSSSMSSWHHVKTASISTNFLIFFLLLMNIWILSR